MFNSVEKRAKTCRPIWPEKVKVKKTREKQEEKKKGEGKITKQKTENKIQTTIGREFIEPLLYFTLLLIFFSSHSKSRFLPLSLTLSLPFSFFNRCACVTRLSCLYFKSKIRQIQSKIAREKKASQAKREDGKGKGGVGGGEDI